MRRHQRQIHAVGHHAGDLPLPAVGRHPAHQQRGHRHQRIRFPGDPPVARPGHLTGLEIAEDVRAMHGQRQRHMKPFRHDAPGMAVAREHVRMHDVKGLLPVQPYRDRERGKRQVPPADQPLAGVAQRQRAGIVDGNAVHLGLLRRAARDLGLRRAQHVHHRRHAHARDDHDLVPARAQRPGLLVHIKAIGRIVRLPVNHHQDAERPVFLLHADASLHSAPYSAIHFAATIGQAYPRARRTQRALRSA